jgi:hypothetical protein
VAKLSAAAIAGIVKYHGASAGGSFGTSLADDSDGPIFVAIALAESGGDPTVKGGPNSNGTYDYGLWQINGGAHKDLLDTYSPWSDPDKNYQMAVTIYQNANFKFTPWSSFNNGTYAAFLPQAQLAWGSPDFSATTTNAVSDAANQTVAAASALPEFLATMTKSETWVRVGMAAAGVLLLLMVVVAMVKTKLPGPLGMVARAAKATKVAKPEGVAA